MKRHSLRLRIVVLLLAAQTAIMGCCIAGTLWYMRRQVRAAFESQLEARMTTTLAQVHQADEKPGRVEFDGQMSAARRLGDLFYVEAANGAGVTGEPAWIADADSPKEALKKSTRPGEPSHPSHSATPPGDARASGGGPGPRAQDGAPREFDFWRNGTHYRGAGWSNVKVPDQDESDTGPPPNVSVFYAMPTTGGDRSLMRAAEAAILVALVVLILSCLAAMWAVSAGLRPLMKLANAASWIDVDRWAFNAGEDALHTVELAPLAISLSGLVRRLRTAFDRERQFVDDAAHELKTAVAIQKSTLQLVDRERLTAGEYRAGVALALEDTARTEALIARMLQLAQLESGDADGSPRQDAAVSQLADSLLTALVEFRSVLSLKGNRVTVHGDLAVSVHGQSDELLLIWRNVIENAIRHSPPSALIEVTARTLAEHVEVLVEDHGEGIAAEDIPHLFERFYRADRSRSRVTGGFGLGLSIAKSSVQRAGGSIDISSSVGQGTCVKVCLVRGPASECGDSPVTDYHLSAS